MSRTRYNASSSWEAEGQEAEGQVLPFAPEDDRRGKSQDPQFLLAQARPPLPRLQVPPRSSPRLKKTVRQPGDAPE